MDAVIKESLRLYSPAFMTLRAAEEDLKIDGQPACSVSGNFSRGVAVRSIADWVRQKGCFCFGSLRGCLEANSEKSSDIS